MLLTSLPDWSGSFDVIGYSLGGVIATTFANYFPHRVDNLLLISPAGLIRSNKLPLLETLIDSRQLPISFAKSLISNGITSSKFLKRNTLVNWQISQHQGFIFSFTVGGFLWERQFLHDALPDFYTRLTLFFCQSTIANDMLFDLQELFQKVQDQFGDCMQAIVSRQGTLLVDVLVNRQTDLSCFSGATRTWPVPLTVHTVSVEI